MNLNQSTTLDAQAPIREHDEAKVSEPRESDSVAPITTRPAPVNDEPSPSERLYEAYRLWAFTGR
jgi:hypothetical protein